MDETKASEELGEEFIRNAFEFYKDGQKRSLLWTITSWQELSKKPSACLLVNTETLFPKISTLEPSVAKFLPEVYACVDQLMIALAHGAAGLHKVAEACEDETERNRVAYVAEILKCIATHVYSIRVLSQTGFDVQVKQIVRTYVEYLELLALVCTDNAVLDEFIASKASDQSNEFWHTHLSKSKARKKRYFNSALRANRSPEEIERDKSWHEGQLRLLSESVHPTVSSVLKSGNVSYDPFITPFDHEAVIGSLIYAFTVFADTLEVPTLEYMRTKLNALGEEVGGEICSRFYTLFMLAVMLGYRKDFVFWGKSDIDSELERALKQPEPRS